MRDRHEILREHVQWNSDFRFSRQWFSFISLTMWRPRRRQYKLLGTSSEVWSLSDFMVFIDVWVCSWLLAVLQIDKVVTNDLENDASKTEMNDRFAVKLLRMDELWTIYCRTQKRLRYLKRYFIYAANGKILLCQTSLERQIKRPLTTAWMSTNERPFVVWAVNSTWEGILRQITTDYKRDGVKRN